MEDIPCTAAAASTPGTQHVPKAAAMEQPQQLLAAGRELVGGFIAGAANVVSGYPFDTLKVRLQASKGMYDGMLDCFWHIWRNEGVSGHWEGMNLGGMEDTSVLCLSALKRLKCH